MYSSIFVMYYIRIIQALRCVLGVSNPVMVLHLVRVQRESATAPGQVRNLGECIRVLKPHLGLVNYLAPASTRIVSSLLLANQLVL